MNTTPETIGGAVVRDAELTVLARQWRDSHQLATALPPAAGEVSIIWEPDPHAYSNDPAYRRRVDAWLNQRLPNASINDARVLADEAGRRVLATTSWFDEHGHMVRDGYGRAARIPIYVELDASEILP